MQRVAIQINSKKSLRLSFSRSEREALSKMFSKTLDLMWLPPKERPRRSGAGSHVSTTVLLFLLGLPVSAAFGAFFKSFFSEAGKDSYAQLRKLIITIWKKQITKAYAVGATTYLIFEFQEEYIAFQFSTGRLWNKVATIKFLEEIIDKDVAGIIKSLHEIDRDIKRYQIGQPGKRHDGCIHVISPVGKGKWRIDAVDSWIFFNE